MVWRILFFFMIPPLSVFGQTRLSGRIVNQKNQAVQNASITIAAKDSASSIMAYTFSNENGNYKVSFSVPFDSIRIAVKAMGFGTYTSILKNETQIQSIQLFPAAYQLQEVIIKPPSPIERRKDTISYRVAAFAQKSDRSIGEVIKRLPGVEVKNDGMILYQGKPINKYYIEGMDLLGGRYKLANENLPENAVAEVQILEHHQPVKMLDSLVFSQQAALNIKLKRKYTFTGQAQLGIGGAPLLWDAKLTPMLFSPKRQFLVSYQTNNIGKNIASQLQTLSTIDRREQFESGMQKQDWLGIAQLAVPGFSNSRWLDNNAHLFSGNVLQKMKKDYKLRLNVSYLNNYRQQRGSSQTQFFTPTDTITLRENQHNQYYDNSLKTNITLSRNTDAYYLKNSLYFLGYWDGAQGNLYRNSKPVTEDLNTRYFMLANRFKTILPFGKQLLTLNSYINFNQTPQDLKVSPGQFSDLLHRGQAYEETEQQVDLQSFYTHNSVRFIKKIGKFTLKPSLGFKFRTQELQTQLLADGIPLTQSKFVGDMNWNQGTVYLRLSSHLWLGKIRLGLGLPFELSFYDISSNAQQQEQNFTRFSMDPQVYANRKFGRHWEVKLAARIKHSFGNIHNMHRAYILKNYRNIRRIHTPLPENLTTSVSGKVTYRNTMKLLFGSLSYAYNRNRKNLLYNTQISPAGATLVEAVLKSNYGEFHKIKAQIDKYVDAINTNFEVKGDFNVQQSQFLLDHHLQNYQGRGTSFGIKAASDITNWFKITYQTAFLFAEYENETQKSRKRKAQIQRLLLKFYPVKQQLIAFNVIYLKNRLFNRSKENMFADLFYRFSWKEKDLDFEIHYTNIFNTKNYHQLYISDYSSVRTSYRLRPAEVMLKVRFSF